MKLCKSCNIQKENGIFCSKCGQKLEEIEEMEQAAEAVDESDVTDKYLGEAKTGAIDPEDLGAGASGSAEAVAEARQGEAAVAEAELGARAAADGADALAEDAMEAADGAEQAVRAEVVEARAELTAAASAGQAASENLSPKEAEKLARAQEKEAIKQAKEERKQAALDLKQQKEQAKIDKKKAKEEMKRLKAEKKARRKFKKLRKALWIIFFLVLILIGASAWYLGHSQIAYKPEHNDKSVETLVKAIANDDEKDRKVILSYEDFNSVLNNNVDFAPQQLIRFTKVTEGYYSPVDKKFVLTLESFLGKTSLLFDGKPQVSEGVMNLELKNPKLGNWKLPLPNSAVHAPITKEVVLPDLAWVRIEDIDFEEEGVQFIYDFNADKVNDELIKLRSKLDPEMLAYMNDTEMKLPASKIIFDKDLDKNHRFKDKELRAILKEFSESPADIINWTLVVPKDMQDEFLALSNAIYGKENTANAEKKLKNRKKGLAKDYDKFVSEEAEKALTQWSQDASDAIRKLHDKYGVPTSYFGDKGHLYSRTLQMYLDFEDLGFTDENADKFTLYGYGRKAILATEVEEEIWYITEGEKKIEKEDKKLFLKKINYSESPETDSAMVPKLDALEIQPFANAIIREERLGKSDELGIKYLAYTKDYALAIGFLRNRVELAPRYFLFDKKGGTWRVIDSFDDTKFIGDELTEEITVGELSPTLLPKYEMADFKRGILSTADRNNITSKLPEGYEIVYHAWEDQNIYIIAKDENGATVEYLFPNGSTGDAVAISTSTNLSDAVAKLSGKSEFPEYKPEFLFDQVNTTFQAE
ncbi:MAG: hypothetical protein Q4A72_04080 [Bacillota bacterium]|nr:hypothetical protein [Bacillota bacterium]